MENNQLNNPEVFLHKGQCKDTCFQAQKEKVFTALFSQPKTMLMVSIETGIFRANICRYITELEKENRVCIVQKGICSISKHRAGFYSTNPNLFPTVVKSLNTIKL